MLGGSPDFFHQQYNRLCCTSGYTQTAASPKIVSGRVVATGMNSLRGCWRFRGGSSCRQMVHKKHSILACCKGTPCFLKMHVLKNYLCAFEKSMLRRVLIIFYINSSSKNKGIRGEILQLRSSCFHGTSLFRGARKFLRTFSPFSRNVGSLHATIENIWPVTCLKTNKDRW